jgi:23S rRNA (guanosine2251-2'-O)-methyltransferase
LLRILLAHQDRRLAGLAALAREAGVPVHIEPRIKLDRLVQGGKHQGVVAFVAAKRYAEPEAVLRRACERGEPPFVLILDGVEDPRNLGAVIRSAEAAGAHGVFIPERRAAGLTPTVAKAAAGATEYLPVSCVANLSRLIETLKAEGLWIYGLEPSAQKPYTRLDLRGPIGLVFGGEGKGIRSGILEKCDELVKIPMRGRVGSLNISTAAAVALFEAARQRTTI